MKWIAFLVSVLGLGGAIFAIVFLSPLSDGVIPFVLLYAGVFFFTAGIFAFVSASRVCTGKTKLSSVIRQGSLLGLLACGLLLLQQFRILSFVSGALVVGLVCLVEFGFLVFSGDSESSAKR
jgi:hypothetical protein